MIGIGADLVDVERFRRVLARTPGVSDWRLTLTHTHTLAQAVAVVL